MSNGRVVGIYISPNKAEPMQSLEQVRALSGVGLEGDRYALGLGTFSKKSLKIRHVSLVGREAIVAANEAAGTGFTPAETRRNLVTEGVDLNELVDRLFTVGDILMFGVELCDPCSHPSNLSGKPGFKDAFYNRGGLRAQIMSSGLITLGDSVIPSSDGR